MLTGNEYLRERLNPRPGDPFYLVLSDLRMAIQVLQPSDFSRVLDFGCGGSPYRPLFGECTYHRADFVGGENLDFEYRADARLPPYLTDYDCVLSTQVLEHVENPLVYLRECYRVMKSGGHLLLTTHGMFEDHACPHDYWRWTADGLRRLVEEAGFKVEQVKKLTTGPRGALFLVERELHRLRLTNVDFYSRAFSLGVRAVQRLGARRRHQLCDRSFSNYRVVDISESHHDIYIVIALLARR